MMASARRTLRPLGIALLAGLVSIAATACGQAPSHSPNTGTSGQNIGNRLVAYASCMRQHGLPNFPDPTSGSPQGNGQNIGMEVNGQSYYFNLSGAGITPGSPQFNAAQEACQAKLGFQKGAGPAASPGASAQFKQNALKFAACMRQNGLPTFPDPTFGKPGGGPPEKPQGGGHGFAMAIAGPSGSVQFNFQGQDPHSAQFQHAMQICSPDLHMAGGPGKVGAP